MKYLENEKFRAVKINRDTNCIPRCLAAKIYHDESKFETVRKDIFEQLKMNLIRNNDLNLNLQEQ